MEKIVNPIALAIIGVAALTTIFGRKNTPAVIDSLGRGFNATCTSAAAGQARWVQPLPSNVVRS